MMREAVQLAVDPLFPTMAAPASASASSRPSSSAAAAEQARSVEAASQGRAAHPPSRVPTGPAAVVANTRRLQQRAELAMAEQQLAERTLPGAQGGLVSAAQGAGAGAGAGTGAGLEGVSPPPLPAQRDEARSRAMASAQASPRSRPEDSDRVFELVFRVADVPAVEEHGG